MTIFTASNAAPGTRVYDIDTKLEIKQVASVDTKAMELICYESPLRVDGDHVALFAIRYRAIHPIYGGESKPCLFHCYGREDLPKGAQ